MAKKKVTKMPVIDLLKKVDNLRHLSHQAAQDLIAELKQHYYKRGITEDEKEGIGIRLNRLGARF